MPVRNLNMEYTSASRPAGVISKWETSVNKNAQLSVYQAALSGDFAYVMSKTDLVVLGAAFVARALACSGDASSSTLNIAGTFEQRDFQISFRPLDADADLSGDSIADIRKLAHSLRMLCKRDAQVRMDEGHADACTTNEAIEEALYRAGTALILSNARTDRDYVIAVAGYKYSVNVAFEG